MATFGDLQSDVSDRLQDDLNTAVSLPKVSRAINTAIKYWKKTGFWFNTVSANVTLTIGSPVIPATGLFSIRSMRLPYQDSTYVLRPMDNNLYDMRDLSFSGRPYGYTYRDGAYQVYYYPDQAYDLIVSGLKEYPDLVGLTDTNDFTENADQLIMYEALSRLMAELRTDPQMSDYYTKRARDEKMSLTTETNRRMATGSATVYETYNPNNQLIGDFTC